MEKIKRETVVSRDFIGWFILKAITETSGAINEIANTSGDLEVEFSVNGVTLPFSKTIKAIEEQIDRMIHEKAVELLNEKTGDSLEVLRAAIDEATIKFKSDLGVEGEY